MNFFQSIVFSIIEGITEFLPISSTGHLILTADLLKIAQTEFVKDFEIIIQLGAILSVIFLYWKTLLKRGVWVRLIAGFIPTAIVGLSLFKIIKNILLVNSSITIIALLLGGIALIFLELIYKEKEHHVDKIENISIKKAFFIGIFQSISVVPGVSRSAATIVGALFLGTKRRTAVEFSFLLAVPTMIAASALDVLKSNILQYSSNEYLFLLTGFVGSFTVALLVIKFFLGFIKEHTFIPFGIYRIILAIIFWIIILR